MFFAALASRECTAPQLLALRTFTLSVIHGRGKVDASEVQALIDAGFTQRQILEVVLGVAQKVMSHYTNHLTQTQRTRRSKNSHRTRMRKQSEKPVFEYNDSHF